MRTVTPAVTASPSANAVPLFSTETVAVSATVMFFFSSLTVVAFAVV